MEISLAKMISQIVVDIVTTLPIGLLRSAIINIKRSKAVRYWEFHYSINYSMISIVSVYRTGLKRREI
jgi:hypothetical protein